MNKVVREHYPVSELPEDLQSQFPGVQEVRVVIEAEQDIPAETSEEAEGTDKRPFSRFRHLARNNFNSVEEIVAHVRALRDEWDERDQFHERLRSGS